VNDSSDRSWAEAQKRSTGRQLPAKRWIVAGLSIAALGTGWLVYSHQRNETAASSGPPSLPRVQALGAHTRHQTSLSRSVLGGRAS
jgi:hypothetical protein